MTAEWNSDMEHRFEELVERSRRSGRIDPSLYTEYDVKRGLRDSTGKGVLTGLTEISICSCGHKERLSRFEERRKKEGAGVSKRDVARYLSRQKEAEQPVNNSFAEALKNIKLS